MKITKKNSGGGPPNPPSITISLHTIILCIHEYINNKIKINHTAAPLTYILFAVVCKNMKKIENPVLPPFWTNQHSNPPTPCFLVFFFILLVKINIPALVNLKINFPAKFMLKINNLSRQKVQAPPPPSESNGRPLTWTSSKSSLLHLLWWQRRHVTSQFVIFTQFVIHNKLRLIATQFVIHRISNCVVRVTRFVIYYKLRQNFIIYNIE